MTTETKPMYLTRVQARALRVLRNRGCSTATEVRASARALEGLVAMELVFASTFTTGRYYAITDAGRAMLAVQS